MTDKELSIKLRELACSQPTPLCEEWTREWQDDTDVDTLLCFLFPFFQEVEPFL